MSEPIARLRSELRRQFGESLSIHVLRALDEVEEALAEAEHEAVVQEFAADWFAGALRAKDVG